MKLTYQIATELETVRCCNCGTVFAMDVGLKKKRLDDGHSFWCPNGHSQYFTENKQAKIDSLQKQLTEERNRSSFFKSEKERRERELAKEKSESARIARRIHAGVCPCCNRTFQNLARHMKTKHPDFNGQKI